MFNVWFERPFPPRYAILLDGIATAIGPGMGDHASPLDGLSHAHAVIAASRIRYDHALMDRAPMLRVISRTGIGVDRISIADATARGIAICNVPDGPSVSTAEHAFTLMLAVAKDVRGSALAVRLDADKDHFSSFRGLELEGLLLGLVGVGRIGSRVARMARALGMRVSGYDPFLTSGRADELDIERAPTLDGLLVSADIVSLHVPLTDETQHLMSAERIAMLKQGAILINTARGGLIDEQALLAAVKSGRLFGAGLDVLEHEPMQADDPLLHCENILVTPHVAGATGASKDRLWHAAITQAVQVLRDERPAHLVNPEVWPARRN